MYYSGMSIPEISRESGIPRSSVRNKLVGDGVALRDRGDGVRNAVKRGVLKSTKGIKRGGISDEWKSNISKGRQKWADENAKGVSLKPSGYLEITRGEHKGRSEHVVIMEENIGRPLNRLECVHHKNGDRSDNRIDNLQLMTLSDHARLHGKENIKNRKRDEIGRLI